MTPEACMERPSRESRPEGTTRGNRRLRDATGVSPWAIWLTSNGDGRSSNVAPFNQRLHRAARSYYRVAARAPGRISSTIRPDYLVALGQTPTGSGAPGRSGCHNRRPQAPWPPGAKKPRSDVSYRSPGRLSRPAARACRWGASLAAQPRASRPALEGRHPGRGRSRRTRPAEFPPVSSPPRTSPA